MARVRLDLPAKFPFSTQIRLRISDINYGKHLANDAVLSLAHEARLRFLAPHGFSEIDTAGASMIMTDAVVVYRSQARYAEVLKIEVAVVDVERMTCDFVFRITKEESGEEVARVKTGIAFFDYKAQRIVRVPQAFRDVITGTEET